MKLFDRTAVDQLLPMDQCIDAMQQAFILLENGTSQMYLRSVAPLPNGGVLGMMPCWLDERCFGIKVISVYHQNQGTGFPSHQGAILLFDSAHGTPYAQVDAGRVTEIRTGAVSALATDLLARPDASVLALYGAGAQARSHLEAIRLVRPLTQVRVYDRSPENAQAFAQEMTAKFGIPVVICQNGKECGENADILCTLTSSHTPILEKSWIKPGAHINAVGACAANDRELPSDLVAASRFYCDSIQSVLAESGDYLFPLQEGLITQEHILGEMTDLVAGHCPGRQTPEEITVFEALGLAIEDVVAAQRIAAAAEESVQ